MTEQEFEAWRGLMRAAGGTWTIDPCRGAGRVLLFAPLVEDVTRGEYIAVEGLDVSAGKFEEAIPHIGDALFVERTRIRCASVDRVVVAIGQLLGESDS